MPIESPYPMISIEEALDIVQKNIQLLPTKTSPFQTAQG